MDFQIVIKQILESCEVLNCRECVKDIVHIFKYFYDMFEIVTGEQHTRLTTSTVMKVIQNFLSVSDIVELDFESYRLMIDKFFDTEIGQVKTIVLFSQPKVIENRYFETLY